MLCGPSVSKASASCVFGPYVPCRSLPGCSVPPAPAAALKSTPKMDLWTTHKFTRWRALPGHHTRDVVLMPMGHQHVYVCREHRGTTPLAGHPGSLKN